MLGRRTFLRALGVLPAAAAGTAATTAYGLNFEQPAKSVEGLYAAAKSCGQKNAYHATLIADVEALLEGRHLPEAERSKILADMRCPMCGCPVTDA
jgi:hypothetical protein